jgi:hypothetical protein
MKNLYLLSLLLTADPEKAEQCFVSGLEECSQTNRVFQEWASSWARRVVIQNAVRLLNPKPLQGDSGSSPADLRLDTKKDGHRAELDVREEIVAVLGLAAFERFAFVMSVLEGYSDQDCALLLGSTRQDLIAARTAALRQIAQSVDMQTRSRTNTDFAQEMPHDRRSALIAMATPA